MAKISGDLSGVFLKSVKRDAKVGVMKFRANLTKSFATKMGWGDLSAGQTACDLEGTINAATLTLHSEQADMFARGEFKSEVQTVSKFQVLKLETKNKKGKGFRFVLDFDARFVSEGTAALAESWLIGVGSGTASASIVGMLSEAEAEPDKAE